MEESSSVCVTAAVGGGGSSAIPHMPSLSLCHGSPTLGENEHSKRFPPWYYFSLLLTPLFSLRRLARSLTLQFFIAHEEGGWAGALIPPLPLFDFELMYTTVKLAKTGSIFRLLWTLPFFFFCEAAGAAETSEPTPRCVWFLDMAWSWRVAGDISCILHGS